MSHSLQVERVLYFYFACNRKTYFKIREEEGRLNNLNTKRELSRYIDIKLMRKFII